MPSDALRAANAAKSADAQHLVCVTTSGELGGAETSLFTLLCALRVSAPGWRITVVAPTEGALLERCRAAGFGTTCLAYPGALAALGESRGGRMRVALRLASAAAVLWPYVNCLREHLRRLDATIVHSNGIKAHVATSLARPRSARLIWHIHEYVGTRPFTARLLRRLAGRPAAIVVNSDSVRNEVQTVLGRSRAIHRVHNAVDVSVFRPEGEALDLAAVSGMSTDEGLVRIGLVATFGRWKGHEVFLDAVARLLPGRRFRAYVIGGPVYQTIGSQRSLEELRAYASERGLRDVVGFTGHLQDVAAALRRLDIVVHASTSPEPFGMVIAEAMASGRAVVAVRAGGARELFQEGVDALGCEMGNAADLARQLRLLLLDSSLRAKLGRAARATALRRFSPDRMAAEFLQVYAG